MDVQKVLVQFDSDGLVQALKEAGINAEYQTILDEESNLIADEVAIYDSHDNADLYDFKLLRSKVRDFIPDIEYSHKMESRFNKPDKGMEM